MKPLISIITPCYNSEKYIGRYIESILNQTYKNIQVIFVNDGSVDNTENIINSYRKRIEDRGIVFSYVYQDNRGLGGAINTGLKLIQGNYFAWCDSDNFYDNTYIEKCTKYLEEHPECDILRCDAYTVMEDDLCTPIWRFSDGNTDKYQRKLFDNAIMEKNFHFGCALLNTASFDRINPNREIYESRQGQNWQLLLPMFYYYESDYIDEPLFYFVYRKDSISNITSHQSIKDKFDQMDEYEKILNESIKGLDIDLEKYKDLISAKYIHRKYYVSCLNGEPYYTRKYHNELSKIRKLTFKEKLLYLLGVNKFVYKLFVFAKFTRRKIRGYIS